MTRVGEAELGPPVPTPRGAVEAGRPEAEPRSLSLPASRPAFLSVPGT
jgi:hypothetical protein